MIKPIFIILFGFLLRVINSAYIHMIGVDTGLEPDAFKFYTEIVANNRIGQYLDFTLGTDIYINVMLFYAEFFGTSPFALCLSSALFWVIGGVYFLKICEDVDLSRGATLLAATLYALWPSAVIYTAEPLRESMQLLFTTLLIFACIRALKRRSMGYALLSIIFAMGAGSTHGALAMGSAGIIALFLVLYSVYGRNRISFAIVGVNLAIAAGFLGLFISIFSFISYDVSGGVLEALTRYQEGSLAAVNRADYRNDISGDTLIEAILGIPIVLFQYLFEPFPGRGLSIVDFALMMENALRFLLLILAIRNLFGTQEIHRRLLLLFIFLSYFGIELIWALGTINWGTASRHHVPAMSMLILAAFMFPVPLAQFAKLRPYRL
jgi:hypothetical protein